MPAAEIHISSVVVHARPESVGALASAIGAIPGAEVHATSPAGKLVVTLETAHERDVTGHLDSIHAMPGVIAATLVYHQVEALQPD